MKAGGNVISPPLRALIIPTGWIGRTAGRVS